ncbi:MAG TPA: T9SS type A sorting domain-containing protein [Chitinophagaceae bacterium]|nr:T9SS type A sorting domain-containing protein [Chitinophagaceae bacterium]
MKHKIIVAISALLLFSLNSSAQLGYIYIHQKNLNEQAAVDFTYNVTGPSSYSKSFQLNSNPAFLQVGDIGAGHSGSGGSYGDGELWAIANASAAYNVSPIGLTGTIYRRKSESSQWSALSATGTTSATAIDGAFFNECVFISGGNVYFNYNNGTTQIYSGGDATDVSAGNGVIAIVTSAPAIKVYNKQYVSGAAINATNGAWTTLTGLNLVANATRLDINASGNSIAFTYYTGTTETLYAAGITVTGGTGNTAGTIAQGSTTTKATFSTSTDSYGNTVGGRSTNPDVTWDDKGYLYVIATSQIYNAGDCVYSNTSGSFVYEPQSRYLERITAGAGGQAWGVLGTGTHDAIWARTTDGSHIWVDDERVRINGANISFKTGGGSGAGSNTNSNISGVSNGDVIILPVPAGTYSFSQSMPTSSWDLGRFTTYVPATSSVTTNVATNSFTVTVAANDVVHVVVFDEELIPKAIALNCTTQVLENFGTGTNNYGDTVQGTAYHYYPQGPSSAGNGPPTPPQDGDYYLVKDLSHWYVNNSLTSHGGDGGYYLLVNASYALDEFYRKRVTNLVPGLQYTISFYAANVNYTTGTTVVRIPPNVSYGLQDASGNIIVSNSTGSIDTTGPSKWESYSFTFTATTSQADLFFRNNTIGGLGNDIALDDLSLNPVLTKLGANEITPTVAPNLCIGSVYTFSNSVTGGTWTSSNSSIASINPTSGVANANTAGTVIITYSYTNQVGCESDTTRELFVTAAPTITTSDLLGKTACFNQPDSLYATATGTATPFTYAWTGTPTGHGLTNSSAQNTSAMPTASGTYIYTVTATDVVGCAISASDTLTVAVNTAPSVTLNTSGSDCVGGTGSFTLTSSQSGGTGTYSWVWSGSPATSGIVNVNAATTSASPTVAGTYSYTVKVSDGYCTVPVSKTVTAYASPAVSVTPSSGSTTICSGGSIPLSAVVTTSTTSPYTYSWSASGTGNGLSGTPTTQSTTATPTGAGTYTYTVNLTDANGCTATGSTTQTVSVNNSLVAPTINITSPASAVNGCLGQSTVNLQATVTGGGVALLSYLWSGPGSITNPTSLTTATAAPTSTGVYTLTVTSTIGISGTCTTTANTPVVSANSVPAVTAVNYADDICTNTKDTVYATASGGTTPYSYAWTVSPSGATATAPTSATSPVSVTTYGQAYTFTITVTDANSCTATGNKTITALNQTGPSISGMASATSICLGSTLSFSPTVTQGSSNTQLSGTPISGGTSGGSTGSPVDAFDGSTSTFWRSSSSSSGWIGLNLGSGNTAIITSFSIYPASGATGVFSNAIVQVSNSSSFSSGNQTIYTFSSGATLTSGVYNTFTATSPTASAYRYVRILFSGNRGQAAEIQFFAGTATAISSYSWTSAATGGIASPTSQNTNATPSAAGTYVYTLKVVDAVGCAASNFTGNQTVNSLPTVTPVVSNPSFCGTNSDSIKLFSNPSGGAGTYSSYAWTTTTVSGSGTFGYSPSSSSQNPTVGLTTGTVNSTFTFNVTVTDANGCTASGSTSTVSISNIPVISATSALANTACAGQSINLTGKVTGGTTAPYTYAWTPSSNSTVTPSSTTTSATTITATATTTTAGNYQYGLSVLDANNCQATSFTTSVININDTPQVAVALGTIPSPLCANPGSTINLTGSITSSTTAPYSYAWSGSGINNVDATTTTAKPATTGSFGFTVTDANGCTGTGYSSSVTVDQATPSITIISCGVNSDGLNYHQLYESNGVNWLWTNVLGGGRFYTSSALSTADDAESSTLQAPYIKLKGVYQVQITDPQGCIGSGQFVDSTPLSTCNSVLAVGNLNLTVKKQNSNVLLSWVTTTEINNDHFEVQRSSDGLNWQVIATVKGFGNSTDVHKYSYTDNTPLNGLNYYRLKQVDVDGHFVFSAVRTVQFTQQWLVHMYPNPASDFVILEFNNDKEEKAFITIQTASGSTVFTKEQTLAKGYNRIKLNQVQPLAQGTYILTMATTTNLYHSKFVKGEK